MAAGPGGDLGRSGLLGGQVGDRVDGLGAPAFLPGRTPLALDAQDLAGVEEQQVVDGGDLDEPAFAAVVAGGVVAVDDGDVLPGQRVQLAGELLLDPLDREQVVGAALFDKMIYSKG